MTNENLEKECEYLFQKGDRTPCLQVEMKGLIGCKLFRENPLERKEDCTFYNTKSLFTTLTEKANLGDKK
jgi:hypothetical protein